jgi:single-strand DNA-binding protein
MASQIQKIMYEGYLAADPEMRFLPSGQAVTNFRMGSTRQWKSKDGQVQKETTWFKVSVWGAQAEIVNQYASKGDLVIVEGRLKPDKETGGPIVFSRNDGSAGASYEITADPFGVRILGKRNAVSADVESDVEDSPDEIPF